MVSSGKKSRTHLNSSGWGESIYYSALKDKTLPEKGGFRHGSPRLHNSARSHFPRKPREEIARRYLLHALSEPY
jgi:hypothetical protein